MLPPSDDLHLLESAISAPRPAFWAASVPWCGPVLGARKALVRRLFQRTPALKGARVATRMYAKLGTTPHALVCAADDAPVDVMTIDADLDVYAYEFEQHVRATFAAAAQCVRQGGHVVFVGGRSLSRDAMACVPQEWRVVVRVKVAGVGGENWSWQQQQVPARKHVVVTVWRRGNGQTLSAVCEERIRGEGADAPDTGE